MIRGENPRDLFLNVMYIWMPDCYRDSAGMLSYQIWQPWLLRLASTAYHEKQLTDSTRALWSSNLIQGILQLIAIDVIVDGAICVGQQKRQYTDSTSSPTLKIWVSGDVIVAPYPQRTAIGSASHSNLDMRRRDKNAFLPPHSLKGRYTTGDKEWDHWTNWIERGLITVSFFQRS